MPEPLSFRLVEFPVARHFFRVTEYSISFPLFIDTVEFMQSLWMLLASAMFAVMGACVKIASDNGASLPLVILFRGIPSVVLILFWARLTSRSLRPVSWKLHLFRNIAGVSSMWLGFYAISNLPLSTAVSLNYTAPLFIAAWMLGWGGTQRDPVRILTVLVGFIGVLAILRPSIGEDHLFAAFTGLMAGGMAAVAMMQIRQLGRAGETEWRTVFIFSCCVVSTSLVALGVDGWPEISVLAWLALIGVGLAGLVGQLAMTRAFGMGSALLTAALQYTTIIFAAVLGIIFWGDIPDVFAWGGITLIVVAGLLSVWRTYSEDRIMQGKAVQAAAAQADDTGVAAKPADDNAGPASSDDNKPGLAESAPAASLEPVQESTRV